MKTRELLKVGAVSLLALTSCDQDAQVASRNISQAADNFQIPRRIIFYNGITNDYILTIEGYCSLEVESKKLQVTCKTGPGIFKKNYLGISDNVTWFAEQLDPAHVSTQRYAVTFKPSVILPDITIR